MTPRPVMTHEERLALINRPFPITTFGSCYPWSGVVIGDQFQSGLDEDFGVGQTEGLGDQAPNDRADGWSLAEAA